MPHDYCMLAQTHRGFPDYIRLYGCFFLSFVYLFREPGTHESPQEIMELYASLVKEGAIVHSGTPPTEPWYRCWIVDKELIAYRMSGERWGHKKQSPGYSASHDSLVIGEYLTQYKSIHFAVPSQSVPAYNPDPHLKTDPLVSKRVFTRV